MEIKQAYRIKYLPDGTYYAGSTNKNYSALGKLYSSKGPVKNALRNITYSYEIMMNKIKRYPENEEQYRRIIRPESDPANYVIEVFEITVSPTSKVIRLSDDLKEWIEE